MAQRLERWKKIVPFEMASYGPSGNLRALQRVGGIERIVLEGANV